MKREIKLDELKKIERDLLSVLDEYCSSFGLTYYLGYGTLIGAIRHKGFIPWDDDIDVIMPRKDYEEFIHGFNNYYQKKDAAVISHSTDNDYYLPMAKLINRKTILKEKIDNDYAIGVYIDIFPLDNLGNDYVAAKRRMKRGFAFGKKLMIKTISINPDRSVFKNLVLKMGKLVLKKQTLSHVLEEMDRFCKEVDYEQFSKYVGVICGISAGNETRIFKREWFENTVSVEFEKQLYLAPLGYDLFLRQLYGNYMQLPPKNQQVTHHAFSAWYIDDSDKNLLSYKSE